MKKRITTILLPCVDRCFNAKLCAAFQKRKERVEKESQSNLLRNPENLKQLTEDKQTADNTVATLNQKVSQCSQQSVIKMQRLLNWRTSFLR